MVKHVHVHAHCSAPPSKPPCIWSPMYVMVKYYRSKREEHRINLHSHGTHNQRFCRGKASTVVASLQNVIKVECTILYRADLLRTSKVSQFDIACCVTHDVASLDVSMNHLALVQVLHSFQYLPSVTPRQHLCKWSSLFKARRQRSLHEIQIQPPFNVNK